jgi:hypothetical protein
MGTEHSPVCARANSDYSRGAAHKSVAFYETTPFRVVIPGGRHPRRLYRPIRIAQHSPVCAPTERPAACGSRATRGRCGALMTVVAAMPQCKPL